MISKAKEKWWFLRGDLNDAVKRPAWGVRDIFPKELSSSKSCLVFYSVVRLKWILFFFSFESL